MLFYLNKFSFFRLLFEIKHILVLALPMLIAQVAQVGTGFVNTVMAGSIGAEDLAAVGLGASIFTTFYVTLMGVPAALNPIFSQLFGANKKKELAESLYQGLWLTFLLGIIGMILILLIIFPVKYFIHLNTYTVDTLVVYLIGISLGMPAALVYRALYSYVSSLNKTRPLMWSSLAALLLNIPLNYILIHGLFGLPKLGGGGCGFATAICYWFELILLSLFIIYNQYFRQFRINQKWTAPSWFQFKKILQIGLPISFSFFLEVSSFSFIALLIANLGEAYVAAQQVVIVITSILYMLPSTLGMAVTVRVGQAIGAGEQVRAYYVSGVGVLVGIFGAVMTCAFLLIAREPIIRIFTSSVEVITVATIILSYAAIFQIGDATQSIASSALRAYKKTKIPMLIHAVSFWIFGLGLGYILAYYFNMKLAGFWMALIVSLSIAAMALVYYLIKVASKEIKRKSLWI